MILFALTPEPFPTGGFPDAAAHVLRSGPWTATALVEGAGVDCRAEPASLELLETPPLASGRAEGPLLLRLRFDAAAGRLEVERPPQSGRPLYWAPRPEGGWLFATRVTDLRRAGLTLEAAEGVLPEMLVYRYVMPPRTLFRNVSTLPYGAGLRLEAGGAPILTPYAPTFDLAAPPEGEIGHAVANCLRATVDDLAPSRDALVVLLSGGTDSSILYKLCRDRFDTPDSYSASNTFGGEDDLEKPYAFSAAEAMGARHSWFGMDETTYRRDFLHTVAEAEEPIHHIQSVLMRATIRGARPDGGGVVVCGEGADTLAGEEFQHLMARAERFPYRHLQSAPLRALLGGAVRLAGRDTEFVRFLEVAETARFPRDDARHLLWWIGSFGDPAWVADRLGVSPDTIVAGRRAAIEHIPNRSTHDLATMMRVVSDTPITQAVWGKLAETAGSRMVFPICTPAVADLAFSIPWSVKLSDRKHIIKLAGREIGVPDFILDRAKSGFGIHEKHWARPGGAFDPLIPIAAKAVDEAWLRDLQTGESQHAMSFWSLLNYGVWKRLMIDQVSVEDLQAELRENEARA